MKDHAARVGGLYKLALAADSAYHAELVREYGRDAGDARYQTNRQAATPQLALLHTAYRAASDALHAATLDLHAANKADIEPIPA